MPGASVVLVLAAAVAAAQAPAPLQALLGPGPFSTLDGRTLSRDDLRGRVVLVDVWATWCAPCLAEMPTLRQLHAAHGDDLRIIGVSVDSLPRRDLRQWLARRNITWPQLFDGRGLRGPLATRLHVESLPRSFLFDASGRLVATDLRGDALVRAVDAQVTARRSRPSSASPRIAPPPR